MSWTVADATWKLLGIVLDRPQKQQALRRSRTMQARDPQPVKHTESEIAYRKEAVSGRVFTSNRHDLLRLCTHHVELKRGSRIDVVGAQQIGGLASWRANCTEPQRVFHGMDGRRHIHRTSKVEANERVVKLGSMPWLHMEMDKRVIMPRGRRKLGFVSK